MVLFSLARRYLKWVFQRKISRFYWQLFWWRLRLLYFLQIGCFHKIQFFQMKAIPEGDTAHPPFLIGPNGRWQVACCLLQPYVCYRTDGDYSAGNIGPPWAPYLSPPGISQRSVRNAKGTFVSSDNVGVQDQSQSVALPVQNASRGFSAIPPPPLSQPYHRASPKSPSRREVNEP